MWLIPFRNIRKRKSAKRMTIKPAMRMYSVVSIGWKTEVYFPYIEMVCNDFGLIALGVAQRLAACPDDFTGSGATYEPRSAWLFSTRNRWIKSCSLAAVLGGVSWVAVFFNFPRNCIQ
jgi:hypothetical protein